MKIVTVSGFNFNLFEVFFFQKEKGDENKLLFTLTPKDISDMSHQSLSRVWGSHST